MGNSAMLEQLKQDKIIAIIRSIPYSTGRKTAEALAAGGISFLEITLNTEGALKMISELREQFGESMRIGAGTVLTVEEAKEAVAAGAEYIISPNLNEEVVKYVLDQGLPVWPGTMTPSEMARAYALGAEAVKVFPVGSLGVKYIKDVRGPLGHIPMITTGGVNLDNIQEVLGYGAIGVGLGGNLVDPKLIAAGDYDGVTKLARAYVDKVKEVQ